MIKISDIVISYIHKKYGIEKEFSSSYVERIYQYYIKRASMDKIAKSIKKEQEDIAESGINFKDLVNKSNAFSKKHAPNCKVTSVTYNPRKKSPLFAAKVSCSEEYSTGPHDVLVSLRGKEDDISKKFVRVSCSCLASRFYGMDYHADKSKYHYGPKKYNGKAPKHELSKRKRFFVCKHIATFFKEVFSKPSKLKKLTKSKGKK